MQEVHILTSRMMGQRRQLDMVADNIANLNTTGYKKLDLDFEEVLSRAHGEKVGSYVQDRALTVNFAGGPLVKTDSPYDLAITGEGFFAVDVNGRTEYTRDGNFTMDATGTLVDDRGNPLLGAGGGPIVIPEGATDVNISRDGSVAIGDGIIAQVGVFTFDNASMQQLQRTGAGGFVPLPGITAVNAAEAGDVTYGILQGSLESSNVNPALEVITMQELSQQYQSAAKLIKSAEDLESSAIQKLGGGGQ